MTVFNTIVCELVYVGEGIKGGFGVDLTTFDRRSVFVLTSCGLSYLTRDAVGGMRLMLMAVYTNKVDLIFAAGLEDCYHRNCLFLFDAHHVRHAR